MDIITRTRSPLQVMSHNRTTRLTLSGTNLASGGKGRTPRMTLTMCQVPPPGRGSLKNGLGMRMTLPLWWKPASWLCLTALISMLKTCGPPLSPKTPLSCLPGMTFPMYIALPPGPSPSQRSLPMFRASPPGTSLRHCLSRQPAISLHQNMFGLWRTISVQIFAAWIEWMDWL